MLDRWKVSLLILICFQFVNIYYFLQFFFIYKFISVLLIPHHPMSDEEKRFMVGRTERKIGLSDSSFAVGVGEFLEFGSPNSRSSSSYKIEGRVVRVGRIMGMLFKKPEYENLLIIGSHTDRPMEAVCLINWWMGVGMEVIPSGCKKHNIFKSNKEVYQSNRCSLVYSSLAKFFL